MQVLQRQEGTPEAWDGRQCQGLFNNASTAQGFFFFFNSWILFFSFYVYVLARLRGTWDLSSLTRDGPHATRSTES